MNGFVMAFMVLGLPVRSLALVSRLQLQRQPPPVLLTTWIPRNNFQRCTTSLFSSFSKEQNVEISPSHHGTQKLHSLKDSVVDKHLLKALDKNGYTSPTPIQSHAIPLLNKGYDVIASAQTGSGKTLMFLLPMLNRLLKENKRGKSPSAIILNPTRELAMQTANVIKDLMGSKSSLKVTLATGGSNVGQQRRQLQNCDILVGTPGRVLQFVDERVLSLKNVKEVVVDEADRMLDLGFEPQLKRIARVLGKHRHTVLCSATFPLDVQRVASEFLKQDYYFVAAGRVGGTHDRISQTLLWVDGYSLEQRRKQVMRHVDKFLGENKGKKQRIIIFCNTKEEAESLGATLKGSVRVVTGDKLQSERNKALAGFRNGKIQILVATDVAARGLDVADVGLVIQAQAPRDADTFVHRVGRTGRAGAKGQAIALIDGKSVSIASDLVQTMQEANQHVPSWLLGMAHVSRARLLEEESVIAAGGGTLQSSAESPPFEVSNEEFSSQDFRRNAAAGSWGSERDTSYHSFDEEAYSSLEDIDLSSVEHLPIENQNASRESAILAEEAVQDGKIRKDEKSPDAMMNPTLPAFRRQKHSEELSAALKRITGSPQVGNMPNRRVISSLSRRGENQRLRFEYIGMFPFEQVQNFLTTGASRSSDSSKNGRGLARLLMVAEKPSIAEAIANALSGRGGPRKRRGISRALPVYEFTANANLPGQSSKTTKAQQCLVTVTSVVGHVFSLGFVEENGNNGERRHPDPVEYFKMPVVKQEEGSTGKLRVVDHLRALAGECDHLILWLDCDAEGENIAHEVIGVARKALEQKVVQEQVANPGSEPSRRIHRARFSAITKQALCDAFTNLVEPDPALSRSVDARQELDLRVGVAMTRLLNWKCVGLARKHFSPTTKLVSYGPCQTPALSFCVDRAREIEAFQPQDYWKVHVTATTSGGNRKTYNPRWKPPRESSVERYTNSRGSRKEGEKTDEMFQDSATYDQRLANQVVELLSSRNARLNVVRVESISERMNPPVGLNTVGLLTAGSKAMGMSPKQVMNVAEKLYSSGFISYPRTETTRYDPTGFDARSVLREHFSHPEWGRTASYLLRTKYKNSGRPPTRGYDAGDHPPITSLKAATRDEVGGGAAWRVYDFVTRHFLGSLGDELKYTRRVAELRVDGDTGNADAANYSPTFELEQVDIDSLGYAGACRWVLRDIGAVDKKESSDPSNLILSEGTTLSISDARSERSSTRPPRFLQEHELIQLMDKHRIGTDASMATHVNNIVDRQYVALCDETGVPLRPPRPPRPGQQRPPRQVGRYLVPTSLGIGLLDLFGTLDDSSRDIAEAGITEGGSPAMLARPRIRALMEEEVRMIATGALDKNECLEKNLDWFQARYLEFVSSLSSNRVYEFAGSLQPIKQSLSYWRRLGVFEPLQQTKGTKNLVGKDFGRKKSKKGAKTGGKTTQARKTGQARKAHKSSTPIARKKHRAR